jgi:hypothetical protein
MIGLCVSIAFLAMFIGFVTGAGMVQSICAAERRQLKLQIEKWRHIANENGTGWQKEKARVERLRRAFETIFEDGPSE